MSTVQVQDVIEDYVNLKRRGVNMIGLCPFHNEKTPSFTVSPAKNLYKCFGCGKGGGAVNFLMEHESFTYPEALRYLAKKYNIKIEEEEQTDEQIAEQQKRESLLLINEMAATYFREQLLSPEGKTIGLSYFKHRGLNEKTIETFGLGYSPKESRNFTNYATAKGYKEDLLKELGLVSTNGYDFYRERVIFPFYNLSGKVVGFGGRILKDNVKAPKYLNSPESEIYNKRKTLYGLYQARTEIRKQDRCILVEGYTDVLSLHQSGIKNAVASSGTSLTVEQVLLIKRFTQHATVLYDGDAAGQKAALRGLDIFLEQGLNVRVVMLPAGHDPDSFVTELGYEKFTSFIEENGSDFLLLRARTIASDYANDPVNKSVQIKELVTSIAKIRDQIKRSLYVKECAAILDVEERTLYVEINRSIKSDINKQNKYRPEPPVREKYVDYDPEHQHTQPTIQKDLTDYQEKDIIRILINAGHLTYDKEEHTTIGQYLLSNLEGVLDLFQNESYRTVLLEYQRENEQGKEINPQYWTNHPDEKIRNVCIDFLSDKYTYANWEKRGLELQTQKPIDENYAKDSFQAILRFKLKKIIQRTNQLQDLLEKNEDESKNTILITAFQNLIKERQALANALNTIVIS